ncbi:hypothetical protein B0H17DRAFT_1134805 [Mycena rosella]|uniref:Protein kinase domain-containing protein n=1 Tax=Mycena rosella TaxID=1033263 RepID=A0AAD7DEV8_MYCRO|nr:hypothetical protein B0H17DRAFT_1134805 [Mycena rosella]
MVHAPEDPTGIPFSETRIMTEDEAKTWVEVARSSSENPGLLPLFSHWAGFRPRIMWADTIQKPKRQTEMCSSPGYTAMDSFDSVLFARMLLEMWAKWDHTTWLTREKDVWIQLQHLGRETIPRQLTHDRKKHEVVRDCLDQMHKLAASFPSANAIVNRVLARLNLDFDQSLSITASDFNDHEKKLKERLSAVVDHRNKLRTAWPQLYHMEELVERFPLGQELARVLCKRLHKALLFEEKREVFRHPTDSRDMRKDTFRNLSKGDADFSCWVNQNALAWVANEHETWVNLCSLGGRTRQIKCKSQNWIKDVLSCAQSASEDLDTGGFEKLNRKAAKALMKLAGTPEIPVDLRDRLQAISSSISHTAVTNDQPTKSPFRPRDAASVADEAHRLFLRWTEWDDVTWVIEEFSVWSEIHRLGSIRSNWKGKIWSAPWAKELLKLAQNLVFPSNPSIDNRPRVALSLRRISHRDNIPNDLSIRLTAEALRLGDSPNLPPELSIVLKNLEYTDADPVYGGSGRVRFGYYKSGLKREKVAIKEFHMGNPNKIKQLFSREAFTWKHLSKTDSHFIVKFLGADISDSRLRLISRQMEHGNVVHFLNLEGNRNDTIRFKTIHGIVRAIDQLHSQDYVHGDIKGGNILIDEQGNPKLGDFGISRLAREADGDVPADLASGNIAHRIIQGSIRWMAPERGCYPFPLPEPSKASDVYSFAYLICEIYENKAPMHDTDYNTVPWVHLSNSIMASTGNPNLSRLHAIDIR